MEAYDSVYTHVQNEIKHTLNETKKKAIRDAKNKNCSLVDVDQGYFDDDFWKELVEYWNSEAHTRRSRVAAENRQKLQHLHSSGAKSFTEMEDVSVCLYMQVCMSMQVCVSIFDYY